METWQIDLGGSRGHEQKKERPCLIWRDLDHLQMAVIIPFTGSLDGERFSHTHTVSPTSANGLEKDSVALVFQITSIDKKRLIKKLGVLDDADTRAIGIILKDLLRL